MGRYSEKRHPVAICIDVSEIVLVKCQLIVCTCGNANISVGIIDKVIKCQLLHSFVSVSVSYYIAVSLLVSVTT